jgi:hypothetical protein
MRMSGSLKWFLIAALLLAVAIFAYVRISDAINDYEMQNPPGETQPETPTPPAPDARPWLHDQLIRT